MLTLEPHENHWRRDIIPRPTASLVESLVFVGCDFSLGLAVDNFGV